MKIISILVGRIVFFVCLSISMVGCAFPPPPESSPTHSITASLSNTEQSEHTPLVTPSKTPSLTLTLTRTPLPTLPEDEAVETIRDLISTNGGCKLPCVWGITPGETHWDEAVAFLMTLSPEILIEDPYTIYRHSMPFMVISYSFLFHVPEKPRDVGISIGTLDQIVSTTPGGGELDNESIDTADQVISKIHIGSNSVGSMFEINYLLLEYGEPQQIYLNTIANFPGGDLPFTLVAYFPNHRLLVWYDVAAYNQSGKVVGCLRGISPLIVTWSQEEDEYITTQYILEWIVGYGNPVDNIRTLSEATDMDVDTFYSNFTNPDNTLCIETPEEYWPYH